MARLDKSLMRNAFMAILSMLIVCACGNDPSAESNVASRTSNKAVIDRFTPLTAGPLRLAKTFIANLPSNADPILPSPDGEHYFAFDTIDGLYVDTMISDTEPMRLEGRVTSEYFGYATNLPFTWRSDSKAIFGVQQDTIHPSGFAKGPVSTKLISIDGMVRDLPALLHAAGPLDGIHWVGGDGLALAEFGTKGRYYEPEHQDAAPTIAMVDARKGQILQSIPIPPSENGDGPAGIYSIDSRVDGNGRIYALFVASPQRWFEWRQGSSLRALPWRVNARAHATSPFTVTPDLKNVLIMRNLSATGVICEHDPNCPPPTPVKGVIAELRSLDTGKPVWTMNGIATNFSSSVKPAISPDGRYALISLPPNQHVGETIALISLQDGSVIQSLPLPSTCRKVGFHRDGRTVWFSGGNWIGIYQLRD